MSYPQFICDFCNLNILPTNPREHCLVCTNYDLCANCALGERFTEGHLGSHQTFVFKQCGGGTQHPVPATIKRTVTVALLPTQSPPAFSSQPSPGDQPPPPGPSPPVALRQPNSPVYTLPRPTSLPPVANTTTGWGPLFHPDSTPTHLFVQLSSDIFSYLDPKNTGNLVPETFERLLEDMGLQDFLSAEKQEIQAIKGFNMDKFLKFTFDFFCIEYVLLERTPAPHTDLTGLISSGNASTPATIDDTHAGFMPCLTPNGLIEIGCMRLLKDPSKEWDNLSRLLHKYNLPRYRDWGDLPRSMLPAEPDARMGQKIASITMFTQEKARQEIEAAGFSINDILMEEKNSKKEGDGSSVPDAYEI